MNVQLCFTVNYSIIIIATYRFFVQLRSILIPFLILKQYSFHVWLTQRHIACQFHLLIQLSLQWRKIMKIIFNALFEILKALLLNQELPKLCKFMEIRQQILLKILNDLFLTKINPYFCEWH